MLKINSKNKWFKPPIASQLSLEFTELSWVMLSAVPEDHSCGNGTLRDGTPRLPRRHTASPCGLEFSLYHNWLQRAARLTVNTPRGQGKERQAVTGRA